MTRWDKFPPLHRGGLIEGMGAGREFPPLHRGGLIEAASNGLHETLENSDLHSEYSRRNHDDRLAKVLFVNLKFALGVPHYPPFPHESSSGFN